MPGDKLVRLRLECSTSMYKAWIYSIKQGLSRFEHDLQNNFHTIVVRFQVRVRSSTVTPTFVRVILELSHIRVCFDIKLARFDGLASQIFELSTEKI